MFNTKFESRFVEIRHFKKDDGMCVVFIEKMNSGNNTDCFEDLKEYKVKRVLEEIDETT